MGDNGLEVAPHPDSITIKKIAGIEMDRLKVERDSMVKDFDDRIRLIIFHRDRNLLLNNQVAKSRKNSFNILGLIILVVSAIIVIL